MPLWPSNNRWIGSHKRNAPLLDLMAEWNETSRKKNARDTVLTLYDCLTKENSLFNESPEIIYSTPITVWPIWGQTLALVLGITELWVFLNFLPVRLPHHKWLTDKSHSVLWIPEKKGINKFQDQSLDYESGLNNGRLNLKRNTGIKFWTITNTVGPL